MGRLDNLPEGYSSRPATMADLERVVNLTNAIANAVIGSDETNLDRARADWETPDFDPRANIRLVETAQGDLVGEVEVWDTSEIPVNPWVFGNVHLDHEGLGIGSHLMAWAEQRAAQVMAQVPDDARVVMRVGIFHVHEPSSQLLEDRGYHADRFFWRMTIDLQETPESPRWPDGIQLRPFDRERDAEAVYRAEDEAFEDHWGHVPESFEAGFERWSHSSFRESAFDPGLWFIAWDGDQIAGLARARQRADHDPEMGWIRALSVRRPWRRQGLALALLQHSLGEFWRRGIFKGGLGVDGLNPMGATRLYEKAGMKVALQYDAYAKELRPGKELMNLGLHD
ncbi:MAG: GNAT family N-acetyltransferase [Anaerolineales bacterium]